MRMWMVNPKLLCKKHLLGEHFEIHKHKHNFVKNHSINKRVSPVVQIEPGSMKIRHDQLTKEMRRRNYNHNSPYEMPDISYLPLWQQTAKVDLDNSLKDLCERCPDCKNNIILYRREDSNFHRVSSTWPSTKCVFHFATTA